MNNYYFSSWCWAAMLLLIFLISEPVNSYAQTNLSQNIALSKGRISNLFSEQRSGTFKIHKVSLISSRGSESVFSEVQQKTVTGTVTDSSTGKTLPGVNILVVGTSTGTATDSTGHYSLQVSSLQDTLRFSYIGYQTRTIPINGRSKINIKLTPTTVKSAQQLVVVGYGTQKKQNVTGAISSVSSKKIQNQPVTNLASAMEGKVSGVQITQNSGEPGSTPQVRIRGLTSINNSNPLYVVDGVPLASNNINAIDPNNIASIQVLKDASAEAIYGSRGANGVVLIKTKHGTKNESNISVNIKGGVQQTRKKLDLLNSQNFVKLNNEGFKNAGLKPSYTHPPSSYTTDTRWQDLLFRSGPIQNYNVAFSGGSEHMTYRASGGYLNKKGIIQGSKYDRISFGLNTTFHPRSNVEFGENLTINKSKEYGVLQTTTYDNVIIAAIEMDPTVPVKTNGTYSAPRYSDTRNPLARTNVLTPNNPQGNWHLIGAPYVEYDPVKGLTLKSQLSLDINFGDNRDFTPVYDFAPNFTNPNAVMYHQKSLAFNWTWDNTITYETDLNANNHIKILGGIEQEKYTYDYINAQNQGQPGSEPYLHYINAGIQNPQVNGQQSQWALLSYLARLNYNYNQTYFLTATYRRDGSSKFGYSDQYGNFPSASVGWVLTKESFMHSGKILNYLKLRGSWGITGNQASVGYYDYSAPINHYYYPFGQPGKVSTTAEPGSLPNPNLHWEQVNQWNIGLDFHLVNDKLTGSVDYFKKATKDMLLSLPVLSESGYTTGPARNVASMVNSGVEFNAGYQQTFNKNINLNVGINFSTLHNKVTNLKRQGEKIHTGGNKAGNAELTEVGHRVASFYGYVFDGIFQNEQQIKNHATQTGAQPGDIRFKDLNGDGKITDADRTFLGTPIPKVNYGFHIGGHWKGLDWNFAFSGVWGNKIFAAYKFCTVGFYLNNYNMTTEALKRWHGEGTSNTIPRLTANDTNHNSRVSSFYLEDGSYLRLRNITIGYTLPQHLFPKKNIKKIRLYISAQDLVTFTKYDGYDPEIGTEFGGSGGTLDMGIDPGTYPQPRTFLFGINFSF